MTNEISSARGPLAAAPRLIKRSLLFSGGAILGAMVSAVSGYALVTMLYPSTPSPAVLAAAAPAPAAVPVQPARQEDPRLAITRVPEPEMTVPAAARKVAPARSEDVVIATKSRADDVIELPRFAGDAIATPNHPATRPTPRPTEPVLASAAVADAADIIMVRPKPRPETVALAVMRPDLADAIPATRPEPRPETLHLAGAKTPSSERLNAPRAIGNGSEACGKTLARAMPKRPSGAQGGEAFFASLGGLSGSERDARAINELARGNMPDFLRVLEPVVFRGSDAHGASAEIVICVTPDYLALGSDRDYVRVPLGLPAAARIAGQFDMMLPTPLMVDAIYAQADVKLSPSPMTPGPQMSSTPYLLKHNATIEGQLRGRGGLVAGQKKDVVMANRMASNPGRVAIYGWHRTSGSPIQPVSTVHGAHYADYSHGIRLVSKTAYLNGRAVALDELLASSRYAALLNKEGPLPGGVIRIASR